MFYVGIDPDTHTTAVAIITDQGLPVAAFTVESKGDTGPKGTLAMCREIVRGFVGQVGYQEMMPLGGHIGSAPEWVKRVVGLESTQQLPTNGEVGAFCVEGQEIYHNMKGRTRNTKSITTLAPVTGAALAVCSLLWPEAAGFLAMPAEWKGQAPKVINQGRTFQRIGWDYDKAGGKGDAYCIPRIPPNANIQVKTPSLWYHLGDAFGLALHAMDEHKKAVRKAEVLGDTQPETSGGGKSSKGGNRRRGRKAGQPVGGQR